MRPVQITDQVIEDFIKAALHEDIREGDHTALATIPAEHRSRAVLKIKDYGVIAGIELAQYIFKHIDPTSTVTVHKKDGEDVFYGQTAFEVEGSTRALLMAERTVLNSMQRMSGIATLASRFAFEVSDLPVKVLDTRKTTPLIRFLEKWAVKIGGCENYRWGLYDWIMIKDNHHDFAGGFIHDILFQVNSLQPTTPAEFFGQLIPTDCCQIISFGIKKQRFHQLRGIFYCSWFSWTQSLINFKQSRIAVVGVIFASLQRCTDTGIFFEQR